MCLLGLFRIRNCEGGIIMRNLSVVLLSIFLLVSMSNIGISSDDIKVKNKDKKKSKNSIDIKSKSMKVSGGSSIVMGSIGNVTNNNKNIKDGQIIINDTVISDDLIKDGKLKNVKVKNNRAWIDGKEIDLKTGKLKEPVKLIAPTTVISSEKIRESVVLIEDEIGFGSGFFVEHDKIATNIHVAAGPGQILVKSPDNETKWTVEGVAAYDVKNDLAILKVKEKGTPLPLANSDAVQGGDFFLAAGFPDNKYKDTIVTMVGNNQIGGKLIRLKSDFFPGNSFGPGYSGGPIVNRKGQVIGVCTLGSEYYGYAVPSNILKALLTRSKSTEPLEQWQKRPPIRAYLHYSQGRMKVNAEDYKEAINDFDKAIQLNPNLAIFYSGRGAAKHGLGNSEGAIADFDTAIRLTPEFVSAYYARAIAKLKLNDYKSAIIDLDKTIEIDPTDANLYKSRAIIKVLLGESEAKQGKTKTARHLYKQAIEELTHAINIDPESHSFYGERGWVKYNLAEFETLKGNIKKARKLYVAAINDCTKFIQQDPNNENTYITRSLAKIALEDFKGAIKDFDRLLQICSKSDKDYYYYQRGLAKKTLGNYKGAIADFGECIRLSPEEAAIAYYERGLAKEALGQSEAAKSDFEKAKELDPNVGQ